MQKNAYRLTNGANCFQIHCLIGPFCGGGGGVHVLHSNQHLRSCKYETLVLKSHPKHRENMSVQ